MYGRSNSPALSRVPTRQIVRRIHWDTVLIPREWISAHRGARIDARCAEARERHVRLMQARRRRWDL
jgi:hypothetical protein